MDMSRPDSPSSAPAPNGAASGPSMYNVQLPSWYAAYTACLQHFLDDAQHKLPVQALAAYLNIRLPCQRLSNPITHFPTSQEQGQAQSQVPLRHYIRRLIATGHDSPTTLETFFGIAWLAGVGSICKQERMNYLFTAKSAAGWADTKAAYDVLPDEHVPFLRPLEGASEEELSAAEDFWSDWINMRDWTVGSRSPW